MIVEEVLLSDKSKEQDFFRALITTSITMLESIDYRGETFLITCKRSLALVSSASC